MAASVAGPTLAQQAPPFPVVQKPSTDLDRRVVVARQLIRQRNYEGASALLEVVLEGDPGNRVVQSLLMTCYEQLKYYEKAELPLPGGAIPCGAARSPSMMAAR